MTMSPSPQEGKTHYESPNSSGDRVVISGVSGLFPKARHVKDFADILYNKIDPITTENDRWNLKHVELSDYIGMVPDLENFDSQFFKMSRKAGDMTEVIFRKLLEQAYQAIYDAGLSPTHLRGKNVGVYIGVSFSETSKAFFSLDAKHGSGILGCSKTMYANRISYWLDVKGPSYVLDQSCCSSIAALEAAFNAINRGECEAALVGSGSLCLHPQTMMQFGKILEFSPDGKTKCFDENADGCVRSEGINIMFLQKAKDALRIYADVVHVKTIFTPFDEGENGPKYGFYRNAELMAAYLKEFYKEADVSPNSVEYIDAYGAGVKEIDKAELEAIEKVFCENRKEPLIVGSVASNIGNSEAASGIAAIMKILLGYQKGQIAANLHCKTPRQDIPGLKDKHMVIATDHQSIRRSYTALNNLTYNGVNAHVLLKGHYIPKVLDRYTSNLPHLMPISGRHENAIKRILDDVKGRPIDPEEFALLQNIHEKRINGHLARGYGIFETNSTGQTISLGKKIGHFDDIERPVWFVYSGMGSQWVKMGLHLMRIPVFAASIERCHKVLEPKGIDLIKILTDDDANILKNILHAFVGITAVQIGLTDILREIGIVPDNIIGHSLGEVCCAYTDGCLTAEETILISYIRGRVSLDTPLIKGCMAAVGLGYQQIKDSCPRDIFVACHNSPNSCTLSGPYDSVKKFIEVLTSQGIFAKEVQSCNIAYHSKYIHNLREPHLKYLREVLKKPILRSERWISTSVPQESWHEDIAQLTPEYFDNNMWKPVLFEEALSLIPANAVLIEIAPHALLQAILKRSIPSDCRSVALTRRGHSDNSIYLLNALGGLFMEGLNPKVTNLYPKVDFPVSTETRSLSHLVEWLNDDKWNIPLYFGEEKRMSSNTKHLVTLHDEEYKYLRGNVVRGRVVYPFAAALVAAWDTFAMALGLEKKFSVHFRDVHLFAQPILHDQRQLKLNVFLHCGTGRFEVTDDSSKVATGYIIANLKDILPPNIQFESTEPLNLDSNDVYELLQERDYSYSIEEKAIAKWFYYYFSRKSIDNVSSAANEIFCRLDEFRTIYKANYSLNEAQLLWTNNWVTLIDGMLQLNNLRVNHSTVCQPTYIRRICIDVDNHMNNIVTTEDKKIVTAHVSDVHDLITCGGITINNIKYHKLPPLLDESVMLKTMKFTPYSQSDIKDDVWSDDNLLPWDAKSTVNQRVVLQSTHAGNLESLKWVETSNPNGPGNIVDVHFAGLNDCDAKRATGVIPFEEGQDFVYGMDFSGTTESGTPVMGLIRHGAISSKVSAYPELLWNVPQGWSLQDAATVPLAYSMAFYCLKLKADITQGMNILIMGGAGALGQAVISVALAYDCNIFTTVSDYSKKQFLLNLFPKLNEKNIFYSGDTQFGDMVLKATKGKGCNIVISCATGELKDVLLNCSAINGVTIDLVQIHSKEKYTFGLRHLTMSRSYMAVDFSSIFDYKEDMQRINELMNEGIEKGYVRPLTYVTYGPTDVVAAFKLLHSTHRNGRVLISLYDAILQAESRFTPDPNSWQIVLCDDVVGINFAEKLIHRGARKLLLNYPYHNGHLQFKKRTWAQLETQLEISAIDLTDMNGLESILKNVTRIGKIEGLFVFTTNSSNEQLQTNIFKLDEISRKLWPSLKHFVVASTSQSFGNNVYLNRMQDKLPVTIIHLMPFREADSKPTSTSVSRRVAVDVVLKALVSSASNIFVCPKENKCTSLLQEIASIAGVITPGNICVDTTLQELGIIPSQSHIIKAFLRDSYNTYIEENVITSLTVQNIRDIEKNSSWDGYENLEGLEAFYSHIGADEILANTNVVVMETRTKYWRDKEIDVDHTSLYIIPGLEGHHHRFQRMCQRLKVPACTLQPGFMKPKESIQIMAHRYAQFLTKKMKIKDDFYLLGYESGVFLALETAKILEMDGRKGTIFCVGPTLQELKAIIEDFVSKLSQDDMTLEDGVAKHMVNLIKEDNNAFAKIEAEVRAAHSWEDKLNICLEEVVGHNGHSFQYLQTIINAALERIIQLRTYQMKDFQLASKIVLIHPASTFKPINMQCLSKQPISVHEIDTPLQHLVQDLRCASIVNQHLSEGVLEFFEQNNLCETYFNYDSNFLYTL